MRKHWGVRVSLVILIALFLLAGGAAGEPKKAPIQIGAIHNVTGALGSIGGPSLAGALLAVKQLNKAGGVLGRSVELLAGDGQSDPAVVAAIARDLVHAPGLSAITGLNDTTMVLAAAPVSEKARASSAKQKAIPGALEATDDFPAVTGSISFGPGEHIPDKDVTVVKIVGTTPTLAAVIRPQKVPAP